MGRVLLIHKAKNNKDGPAIFNNPDDVSINIAELASEPAYATEGVALADALWNALPAGTLFATMKRLRELDESALVQIARNVSRD